MLMAYELRLAYRVLGDNKKPHDGRTAGEAVLTVEVHS